MFATSVPVSRFSSALLNRSSRASVRAQAVTRDDQDMGAIPTTGTAGKKMRTLTKKSATSAKAAIGSGDAAVAESKTRVPAADSTLAEKKVNS